MFVGAFVVGAINGILIRFANFTPIAATLAMYIGIQGLSFLLRDGPGGYISGNVVDVINWQIGPIPVAFLAARRLCGVRGICAAQLAPGLAASGDGFR